MKLSVAFALVACNIDFASRVRARALESEPAAHRHDAAVPA
jgi:hypothetical protein